MSPPNARRRPRQETASMTSRGTTTVNPDDTANAVDQAIADACAIRGCACAPEITVTRDGAIRRVADAHDPCRAAIGGDAA